MTKNKMWCYENNKYTNAEKVFASDKYEEHKNFLKGIEEYVRDFFGDKFGLLKETFFDVKSPEIVISHKVTGEKIASYEKGLDKNSEMMKSILSDSWALAEGLRQDVSHTQSGKGLSYCSGLTLIN